MKGGRVSCGWQMSGEPHGPTAHVLLKITGGTEFSSAISFSLLLENTHLLPDIRQNQCSKCYFLHNCTEGRGKTPCYGISN